MTYVNAGHNPAIVSNATSTTNLEATGIPLGLFAHTTYEARTAILDPGGALLAFTDGLTDSISGDNPEQQLRDALTHGEGTLISNVKALIDPRLTEDDVTILL